MHSPTISIIVPVYNVELYLRKCIDSILAQTFNNFECILIDDGSTDNCPIICDEYAEKDYRVVVIHQENSGVSAARNRGLDIARGEWIGFVDSDDWCDFAMFEYLYKNALKHKVDVSVCGMNICDGISIRSAGKNIYNVILSSKGAMVFMFETKKKSFGGFSFNKLIKKNILEKNRLRYNETVSYMEDVQFFYYVFKAANNIYYSSQPYYFYRKTNVSVTSQVGFTSAVATAITVLDELIREENDCEIKQKIYLSKIYFIYGLCVKCILFDKKDERYEANIHKLKNSILDRSIPFYIRCKMFVLVYMPFLVLLYFTVRMRIK